MKINIYELALEVTRRCNLKCAHCMRGKPQNINMSDGIVDKIIDSDIGMIDYLLFSGGEPTLNPNLIINTIDKIIEGKLNVNEIAMVTNGQIYNQDIVDAFNRYNEYQNEVLEERINKMFNFSQDHIDSLIEGNKNKHVRITFSTDRFHNPISQQVKDLYKENAKKLKITEYSVRDEKIIRTGNAIIGEDYSYEVEPIKYYKEGNDYSILGQIYITANGYVTSNSMGQYIDMDNSNFGHISDISFANILVNYGVTNSNSQKKEIEEKVKVKTI